jgi:hypothetical protein
MTRKFFTPERKRSIARSTQLASDLMWTLAYLGVPKALRVVRKPFILSEEPRLPARLLASAFGVRCLVWLALSGFKFRIILEWKDGDQVIFDIQAVRLCEKEKVKAENGTEFPQRSGESEF